MASKYPRHIHSIAFRSTDFSVNQTNSWLFSVQSLVHCSRADRIDNDFWNWALDWLTLVVSSHGCCSDDILVSSCNCSLRSDFDKTKQNKSTHYGVIQRNEHQWFWLDNTGQRWSKKIQTTWLFTKCMALPRNDRWIERLLFQFSTTRSFECRINPINGNL